MNKEELSAQRAEKWREELRRSRKAKERTDIPRVKMKELDPAYRITNREEVNCGLTREQCVILGIPVNKPFWRLLVASIA